MEKAVRDLESKVASQEKQIARYESRLKDVVTAYKGLLKEKEALDAALATPSPAAASTPSDAASSDSESAAGNKLPPASPVHVGSELNQQIATLMNSLATLSAEKSRMEASFQADKRQLRQELQARDQIIREQNDRAKSLASDGQLEVEKMKSKLIVERHAREKELTDHMAMVKEMQKLLSDERHLKDNLEMQLTDLRAQFARFDTADARVAELQAELEQARRKHRELKATARTAMAAAAEASGQPAANGAQLQQLHGDMEALRVRTQRTVALEQKRVQQAEERGKRLAAVHEERVVTLEARLAELSASVGAYDRLRQADQDTIFRLKEQIARLQSGAMDDRTLLTGRAESAAAAPDGKSIDELLDDVQHLKKLLILENARQTTPRDLSKLFAGPNDHRECGDRYERLRVDYERALADAAPLQATVETQKQHVRTLQDKIEVLNRNIDEQEQELKQKTNAHYGELKTERAKWKELVAAMEMDFRGKVADLEVQLQKQRERSLRLLEEKELEIKALKQSFEGVLLNATGGSASDGATDAARRKISLTQFGATNADGSAECHMLHYVHELSRKEVEIAALRKARNTAEASLRQALQDKVTSQQELHDRIGDLECQVDRLERCKSRESANLEYLKNVVLSFLQADGAESRRHMVNAIGAVLQFSPAERKTIENPKSLH